MVSKVLAGLLAAAVLSVGGYTYWQYAGGCGGCGNTPVSTPPDGAGSASETPSCCQQLSRTNCFSLPPGDGCCDDAASAAAPEVLDIPPREVK